MKTAIKTSLTALFFMSIALAQEVPGAPAIEGLDSEERRAQERAELEQWSAKLYRLFRKADTNQDRNLSLLELRNHLDKKMTPGSTSQNDLLLRILRKRNPKLDIDKDGILTKEEVVAYMDQFIEQEEQPGSSQPANVPAPPVTTG